jgi:sigma-E factor negative regulatory protein RseA
MERISVLMDGELDDEQADVELDRLREDPELRSVWHAYHAIGDALRGEVMLSSGFESRLRAALEAEPTVLAPRRRNSARRVRFYALSAAASLAGVAAVAWLALVNQPGGPAGGGAQIAQSAPELERTDDFRAGVGNEAVVAQGGSTVAEEYLMAHQQYSPTPVVSGAVSFIRTVGADERDLSR